MHNTKLKFPRHMQRGVKKKLRFQACLLLGAAVLPMATLAVQKHHHFVHSIFVSSVIWQVKCTSVEES
uniref:Uncharacterized protein n=1 Tax=Arundo donax TaxID=35708 RepID=A0A0A9CH06_ARUDO